MGRTKEKKEKRWETAKTEKSSSARVVDARKKKHTHTHLEVECQVVAGHPLRHEEEGSEHERGVDSLEEGKREADSPKGPEHLRAPPEDA